MWVIKIGGSLARAPVLSGWLQQLAGDTSRRWVLVPGGGPYADTVREMQQRWQFDDRTAHLMALQAMALYAAQLQAIEPSLVQVQEPDELLRAAGSAIWSPGADTARQLAGLPEDWRLSADSIALWLAMHMRATGLVLLKSTAPPVAGPATALAASGYLDAYFPQLLRAARLPVYWRTAEDPASAPPALDTPGQRIVVD